MFWKKKRRIDGVVISESEGRVLASIWRGLGLRSRRNFEGEKEYFLESVAGVRDNAGHEAVTQDVVSGLRKKRLIETNHKFPMATYLLTERGRKIASQLADDDGQGPLAARGFVQE